jgi:CubicO group peptidase (beta-lactamase class C family)
MQSGLAFEEDYGTATSDVNVMLFRSRDTGAVAAKKTLAHEPGTHWSYSSGTTNLLARTLRGVLESNGREFPAFARNNLFSPLGAASVVMEPDASGVFIGSSFMYATAQDWARLGQLYMQDGVWNGERLLPAGWTDFVAEPAAASDGRYGGQFWLNRDGSSGRQRDLPALPEDMYYMSGHEGQYVFIVPSTDIIIVRLGVTRGVESSFAANAPLMERIYIAATAADA